MATGRTMNFSSADIAGMHIGLRHGRLMVRTSDMGRYEWDASAELDGINLSLNQLATAGDVAVEFETRNDGRFSGQAFVEVSVSSSAVGARTRIRLRGTGPLDGWAG